MNILLAYGFWAAFGGLLIFAAINDARQYIIPNWVSLTLIALYILYISLAYALVGSDQSLDHGLEHIATALLVTAIFFVLFALGHMGGGDVKLIGAISLWAGPQWVIPFLLITAIAGGLLSFVWLLKHRSKQKRLSSTSRRAALIAHPDGTVKTGIKPALPYGIAIAAGGVSIALMQNLLITAA